MADPMIATLDKMAHWLKDPATWNQNHMGLDQDNHVLTTYELSSGYISTLRPPPRCMCLLGVVVYFVGRTTEMCDRITKQLVTTLEIRNDRYVVDKYASEVDVITTWNDHKGRTHGEVLQLIADTKQRLEATNGGQPL